MIDNKKATDKDLFWLALFILFGIGMFVFLEFVAKITLF